MVLYYSQIFQYIHASTFSRYCLQVSSKERILKCDIEDSFKVNGKQRIKRPKKDEYVRLKNFQRKTHITFYYLCRF